MERINETPTSEKILNLFPAHSVKSISGILKVPMSYIIDVLVKNGELNSRHRSKGFKYGDKRFTEKTQRKRA